jgi:DUF1680 family protein
MIHWTRREFLETAAAASAMLATGVAHGIDTAAQHRNVAGLADGITPVGKLADAIALTGARLTTAGIPAYSDEMVLADVTLDSRRRFFNFSGDVSGRYLEALSLMPAEGRSPDSLANLVLKVIANQRPDGRFGRTDLAFTAAEIGTEHMALLWGNGRLLVGLTGYHAATGNAAALSAARRLADFLLAARQAAKTPEVAKRLQGQGAFGIICFTQLTEGLVRLGHATGDRRYLDAAAEIVPSLGQRGVQHSHGYLTTLRGALMLYEETRDPAVLAHVEERWNSLTASGDYIVDGSVLEYFGWSDPANEPLMASAKAVSGPLPRNEGCGLADLVRLTLNLFRVTGRVEYLEQGERCLLNAFAHNQYATGDFGSRVWFPEGITPTSSVNRSWWCCTMHGYRAFRDVLETAITADKDDVSVNLFEELDWRRTADIRLRRTAMGATIEFERPFKGALRVRLPHWSAATTIVRNGRVVEPDTGSYAKVGREFAAGEKVEIKFSYRTRIIGADGTMGEPATLSGTPRRAAIYCGPYLMAADEELAPEFFGEPWPDNKVPVPMKAAANVDSRGQLRLHVHYEHDGFPGIQEIALRPIGEKPATDQRTLAIWLNCKQDVSSQAS